MSKKQYIAAVLVTCYVDGVRTDVPAGKPLPPLSEHDTEQLLKMAAISDPEAEAAAAAAEKRAEKKAGKEFADARAAVQAADESIKAPDAPAAT